MDKQGTTININTNTNIIIINNINIDINTSYYTTQELDDCQGRNEDYGTWTKLRAGNAPKGLHSRKEP
jgi:hypothetical protein